MDDYTKLDFYINYWNLEDGSIISNEIRVGYGLLMIENSRETFWWKLYPWLTVSFWKLYTSNRDFKKDSALDHIKSEFLIWKYRGIAHKEIGRKLYLRVFKRSRGSRKRPLRYRQGHPDLFTPESGVKLHYRASIVSLIGVHRKSWSSQLFSKFNRPVAVVFTSNKFTLWTSTTKLATTIQCQQLAAINNDLWYIWCWCLI